MEGPSPCALKNIKQTVDSGIATDRKSFSVANTDRMPKFDRSGFQHFQEVRVGNVGLRFITFRIEKLGLEGSDGFHLCFLEIGDINYKIRLDEVALDIVIHGSWSPGRLFLSFLRCFDFGQARRESLHRIQVRHPFHGRYADHKRRLPE